MTMARSAGEAPRNHVTLELECFDRLCLNACVSLLQAGAGAASRTAKAFSASARPLPGLKSVA